MFSVFFGQVAASAGLTFDRNLSRGASGVDVFRLQQLLNRDPDTRVAVSGPGSPGEETFFFGPATYSAVKRFQEKYRSDVLSPVGLSSGTGFVGPLTRAKLTLISQLPVSVSIRPPTPEVRPPFSSTQKPTVSVENVAPSRVRRGEKVTVIGSGFTPTGNTVVLAYGLIEKKFENLTSSDGRAIVFTYEPADVTTMTKPELLALPPHLLGRLEGAVGAVGGTLDDIAIPYRGIDSMSELDIFLRRNGHALNDIYDYFYVTVLNANGQGMSRTALLYGLPKLPFDSRTAAIGDSLLAFIVKVAQGFIPRAEAQGSDQAGGGFNSGMVMVCTCNGGFMTFMQDYAGGGSNFYYFEPGYQPTAGTGIAAAPWLGFYEQNSGTCEIGIEPYCVQIQANKPGDPWGAAL